MLESKASEYVEESETVPNESSIGKLSEDEKKSTDKREQQEQSFRSLKACARVSPAAKRPPQNDKKLYQMSPALKNLVNLPNRPQNSNKRADFEEKLPKLNQNVSRKHQKGSPNRSKMLPKWSPGASREPFREKVRFLHPFLVPFCTAINSSRT